MSSPVALRVSQVCKSFLAGDKPVRALNDVTIEVLKGQFLAVVGASGSGKTTLLRVMGGLERPDSGDVRILCPGATGHPVGMVFQEHRLFPWLTVMDNVAFPLRGRVSREEAARRAMDSLRMVGLAEFALAKPRSLSGGMAQRAALARALAFDPEVILMDEPLGALDYFTRRELQLRLQEIALKMKKTFVMVTHDVDEAIFLADMVAILSQGELVGLVPVEGPRPRDLDSPEVFSLRRRVLSFLESAP